MSSLLQMLQNVKDFIVAPKDDAGRLYSERDNTGAQLTPAQQDYFKDSKVRDDKGRLLKVYHGTMESFTAFSKAMVGANYGQDEAGFFFTDDENTARSYADTTAYGAKRNTPGIVMPLYLNISNPLVKYVKFDPISTWDENYETWSDEYQTWKRRTMC